MQDDAGWILYPKTTIQGDAGWILYPK